METQFATLWESISDVIPDRKALICGELKGHGVNSTKGLQGLQVY